MRNMEVDPFEADSTGVNLEGRLLARFSKVNATRSSERSGYVLCRSSNLTMGRDVPTQL